MRLGFHWMLWTYRSAFSWTSAAGFEHESDPDVFTAWLYLGFFGIALSWCRDGWLYAHEADQKHALAILKAAPEPNVKSEVFCNAWDEFDREDDRIDANKYRNGG